MGERAKKLKKRRITESTVSPTYGGFRRSKLDTVAGSSKSIFMCEGVVQGRSRSGACAAISFPLVHSLAHLLAWIQRHTKKSTGTNISSNRVQMLTLLISMDCECLSFNLDLLLLFFLLKIFFCRTAKTCSTNGSNSSAPSEEED